MSKVCKPLLALALTASTGLAVAADMPTAPPSTDLNKARALIEKKDWNAAIAELGRLAKLKLICGGESCEEQQDLAKASAAYRP